MLGREGASAADVFEADDNEHAEFSDNAHDNSSSNIESLSDQMANEPASNQKLMDYESVVVSRNDNNIFVTASQRRKNQNLK